MFEASLYSTIYYLVVIIATIIATNKYRVLTYTNDGVGEKNKKLTEWIFPAIISLFIGLRPVDGRFVDMVNYNSYYYAQQYGKSFSFDADATNYIFDNLFSWLGANYYDITVFFLIIAICYFMGAYKAMKLLFKNHAFLAFVVFLGAFSTLSYATNGIKAGAAASFFLCALGYREKKIKAAICLILSLGFHHSMIMPIMAYIISLFLKNSKYYFAFWIFALLMAVLHISGFQEFFAGMSDESSAEYLNPENEDWGGKTGFRLDLVIYSFLPVFIGYMAIFKYKLESKIYSFLLNVYLLTNAVWMLCMYAAFTNRIAYLSWLMYPVVTIYPFFCKNFMPEQTTKLKQLVWIQLLFTLFMYIVYYG